MRQLQLHDLTSVVGGAGLDPAVPQRLEQRVLQQCGPQIDAYTAARRDEATDPTDTRREIHAVAAGRSLALCASNVGFDPPPAWRAFSAHK